MMRPKVAINIETKRSQKLKLETKWKQVKPPRHWHPEDGDELVGHFVSFTRLTGTYGEYTAVLIKVPYKGLFYISGAALIRLMDASDAKLDDPVRIVFRGWQELYGERSCKLFELFVEDNNE